MASTFDSLHYLALWVPRLGERLEKVGVYHNQVSHSHRVAGLYEARLSIEVRDKNDPVPKSLWLTFVTADQGERGWALLTRDGSPYDEMADMSESPKAKLPIDVEYALRNLFSKRVELRDWWAFEDLRLKTVRDSLTALAQNGTHAGT